MFPECRLLQVELNIFNTIVVQDMCVIIIARVGWIGEMIISQFAGFPRVNAHHVGHFVQPLEYSVR